LHNPADEDFSMPDIQRLRETVTALERELHDVQSLDDETRSVLVEAVDEIRATLAKGGAADLQRASLIQRLTDATQRFEEAHPALTRTLASLIDGLGQMGI
jgi:signal transduction histidine kinase